MAEVLEKEAEAKVLEAEIAEVCGLLNAASARLVELIRRVVDTGAWEGAGIRSPEHWLAWKCGLSAGRARGLVAMARGLEDRPETRAAFEGGELSEDQVRVVCRVPAEHDAEAATFARSATVAQLKRVLRRYQFDPPRPRHTDRDSDESDAGEVSDDRPPAEQGVEPAEEPRRVTFGFDDEGRWRLSAMLSPEEGALWERALAEGRDWLFAQRKGQGEGAEVTWADALVAIAERFLTAEAAARPHRDRYRVLLHLDADRYGNHHGRFHLGPALPDSLRRYLCCDTSVVPVWERAGRAVSVGRAFRTVPERTRIAVEDRDGACRVPGCERTRWLHVHHVRHWEDGGPTDTSNLVAICSYHHRLHHRGHLGISGNADEPDGIVFTDQRGRRLAACGRPAPPREPPQEAAARLGIPNGKWVQPEGERFDGHWLYFNPPSVSA